MIKTGVGRSNNPDAAIAGAEAAEQALTKAGGKAELIIVFSTVAYDQEKMLKGVRSISREIPLVGCSDFGEITTEGPVSKHVAAMALSSDTIDFTIGIGEGTDKDSHKAGAMAARAVKEKVVEMAVREDVPKVTGYFIGGVSPLGTHRPLPVVMEASILTMPEIAVSAGQWGCQAVLRPSALRDHLGSRVIMASFAQSPDADEE